MRYAILADIHSNLEAFRAVLRDIENRGGVDELWCLGDIVGYGPEPSACLDIIRERPHVCVAGNHDWAAAGRIDTADFNPDAAEACKWTAGRLTSTDKEYLQNLPLTITRGEFTLAHGSPRDPLYEYIFSALSAEDNLRSFGTAHCLIGHTHVPAVFSVSEGVCRKESLPPVLRLSGRSIINPGGVGQPRDGDPRASYAVYDDAERIIYSYRVPYDIAAVQEKMSKAGLPEYLALRLSDGL